MSLSDVDSSANSTWRRRFSAHWPIKTWAIPLGIGGFFGGYFYLLHHPVFPVVTMPLTGIDGSIAFQPWAMLPYLSLWLYVFLGAGSLQGTREVRAYGYATLLMTAVGFGAFYFCPTATPPSGIDWAEHPSFQFLKNVDAAGNACPSLHVAFAVFTAIWLERLCRTIAASRALRIVNVLWVTAIVYSTIATKQHVFADAVAGFTLGCIAGLADARADGAHLAIHRFWPTRLGLGLIISFAAKLMVFVLGWHRLSPAVASVLFFAPDGWVLAGLLLPNFQSVVPTATRFAADKREVWLTIDDGPEPATTRPILDLLDQHGAKATFFVIGQKVAAYPDLVREIHRRGHTLGNHTASHPLATFWLAGPVRTTREVEACDDALRHAGIPTTPWFRAPAGIKTFFLRQVLAKHDRVLIGWSARAMENFGAARSAPLRRLTRNLRPGAILLLHESAPHAKERIALLSALLEHLTTAGYRCTLPSRPALR